MQLGEETQAALTLNLQTLSGVVQVIVPTENVQTLLDAINEALVKIKIPDGLVVTKNIEGAKQMAEMEHEIRTKK